MTQLKRRRSGLGEVKHGSYLLPRELGEVSEEGEGDGLRGGEIGERSSLWPLENGEADPFSLAS